MSFILTSYIYIATLMLIYEKETNMIETLLISFIIGYIIGKFLLK